MLISGIDSRFATVPVEDRGDRLTYAVSSDEPGELGHGGLSLIPTTGGSASTARTALLVSSVSLVRSASFQFHHSGQR